MVSMRWMVSPANEILLSVQAVDSCIAQLKAIIDNLYFLIVQSHDYHGPQTTQAMTAEM